MSSLGAAPNSPPGSFPRLRTTQTPTFPLTLSHAFSFASITIDSRQQKRLYFRSGRMDYFAAKAMRRDTVATQV